MRSTGLERIRFTSPHPKGYGDDLVEAYGRLPKLCRERAPPGAERQRPLAEGHASRLHPRTLPGDHPQKLRACAPEIGLTTDIIVGFPGETEEDFEQDPVALVREIEFDNAFLFKYSPAQRHAGCRRCRTNSPRKSSRNATPGSYWNS
jgi:tRNA-2-methylthio-N6-dimethylallyladenosine synthase